MSTTTLTIHISLRYLPDAAYLRGLAGLVRSKSLSGPVRVAGDRFWQCPAVRELPAGFNIERHMEELRVSLPGAEGLRVFIAVESTPPVVVGSLLSVVEVRSTPDADEQVALVYRAAILSRVIELITGNGYTLAAHDFAAGTASLQGPAKDDAVTVTVTNRGNNDWFVQLTGHRATMLRSIGGLVGAIVSEDDSPPP